MWDPVQLTQTVELPARQTYERSALFAVPADSRLVVEHVSVLSELPFGQRVLVALLLTDGDHRDAWYPIEQTVQGTFGGVETYVASGPLRAYAGPNASIDIVARRDTGFGLARVRIAVSGYLVDVD